MLSVTPLKPSTLQEIKEIRLLGKGGFGTAYSILSKSGKRSVIKIVNESYSLRQYGYSPQEIMLSCSYSHPNLAHGIGVVRADEIHPEFKGKGLAIALTEYEHNLSDYLHLPESEKNIYKIVLDIIHGYKALRELGWLHLDIKPDNMLVRTREPFALVISDFGTCRPVAHAKDARTGIAAGTPYFMPPETRDEKENIKQIIDYDEKFDMYSLGVTLQYLAQQWSESFSVDSLNLFAAQAFTALVAPHSRRWTLSDLLQSDFYNYLCRLEPNRKYVSPSPVISQPSFDSSRGAKEVLRSEISSLRLRAYRAGNNIVGSLLRSISVEVIARAQQLLLSPRTEYVRAALFLAYKMVHTGELNSDQFFGTYVNFLPYEEEILLRRYNQLQANSVFDYSGDLEEYAKALDTSSTLKSSSCKLSLNAGGKNATIIQVE